MISVCLASYNGEKYIKAQIDSILNQIGEEDEIIVSDDGSTDTTLHILQSYNDPRIKIFNNVNRRGVVGNFDNALSKASGDYIFLSDQDDVWLPDKINKCIAVLNDADLVMHDAKVMDEELNVVSPSFFALRESRQGYWKNLWKNSYIGCCLAFRKDLLYYVLPIPNVAMHDIWIGLMASLKGKVTLIKEPLLLYRRHGNNASPTAGKSNLGITRKFSYRIKMLYYTLTR